MYSFGVELYMYMYTCMHACMQGKALFVVHGDGPASASMAGDVYETLKRNCMETISPAVRARVRFPGRVPGDLQCNDPVVFNPPGSPKLLTDICCGVL